MMTLGELIRAKRSERGFTLRTLASRLGVTYPYVGDIEQGARMPSEGLCFVIADVLKLDVDEVFALAGKVPPDLAQIIASHPKAAREALTAIK